MKWMMMMMSSSSFLVVITKITIITAFSQPVPVSSFWNFFFQRYHQKLLLLQLHWFLIFRFFFHQRKAGLLYGIFSLLYNQKRWIGWWLGIAMMAVMMMMMRIKASWGLLYELYHINFGVDFWICKKKDDYYDDVISKLQINDDDKLSF